MGSEKVGDINWITEVPLANCDSRRIPVSQTEASHITPENNTKIHRVGVEINSQARRVRTSW